MSNEAQLAADIAIAEAELDYYREFLAVMRPYMEGTTTTVAAALRSMPEEQRDRALFLGTAAGVFA